MNLSALSPPAFAQASAGKPATPRRAAHSIRFAVYAALILFGVYPAQAQSNCYPTEVAEQRLSDAGYALRDDGIDDDGDTIRVYQDADGRWLVVFLPAVERGQVMCRINISGPILQRQDVKPGRGA